MGLHVGLSGNAAMKILALMPDAYGGFGGIAQYNRDMIDALSNMQSVEEILSLTRHLPDSQVTMPAKLVERCLPGSSLRYLSAALIHGVKQRPDVILCGHINLLPVAALLKKLTQSRLILEAYGIEAWQRGKGLRSWGTDEIDLVIAISRFTREQLMSWSALKPHLIKVVPNAVHLSQYAASHKPANL